MMGYTKAAGVIFAAAVGVGLAGCAGMPGGDQGGSSASSGSAGGTAQQNASAQAQLTHCSAPLGSVAVAEDTTAPWYGVLSAQYHLGSTVPVLNILAHRSGCFTVMESRRPAPYMYGQPVPQGPSADYTLSPSITFSDASGQGVAGALSGVLSRFGQLGSEAAQLGGSVSARKANAILTLDDNHSSVQIAEAQGTGKGWDFGSVGAMLGGSSDGGFGGYMNTTEGKVVVGALVESFNNLVKAVQTYQTSHGAPTSVAVVTAPASMSLADAQRKLDALGYAAGTPDGSFGPHTRMALIGFQHANGLPQTGQLDSATKAALER